jgi:hypothetical protein
MKRKSVLLVLAFVVALGETSATPASAHAADPNTVITWNGIMMATFATAVVPPPAAIRLGAIVQASVFDAVNGIDPQYTAVHVAPAGPADASRQAAAAAAAHTALVSLFPLQKTTLDAQFASSIAAMPDGDGANSRIAMGIEWGNSVAGQILAWRAADGFSTVLPYTQGFAPGDWAPTPSGSGPPPKFQSLSITTPFAMTSPSEFRPAGPPALTSARYATDFKEVKDYGSATSTFRSTFQTETAKFWQMDTPIGIWDRVADSLAMANHLNLLRSARLLAMVNLAEADAIISVFDAKAHFNSWRPETAIAGAALDGNPDTTTQAGWTTLLTTPYFQEYPSAHSGVSSAATVVLASFFGNEASFTVTSAGLPGVVRNFHSFSAAVAQVADARIYAGFHFRFSTNDATRMGKQIGRLAGSTLMQRVGDQED